MSARRPVNGVRRGTGTIRRAKLGQNFLNDAKAARKIVEALADIGNSVVIEIGSGRGALTRILAEHAGRLIATELDEMLARQLRAAFANHENVEILQTNFLDVTIYDLLSSRTKLGHSARAKIVGNIPYYITSDILLRLFEQYESVETIVIMVQKEVADRLAAQPGSRDYGLLTVTAQLFSDIENLFTLPPEAFSPPPKIYSSVLRLRIAPKASSLNVVPEKFLRFCKLAFAQKRKTLFNNLRREYAELPIKDALRSATAREDVRAEALSLAELAEIYRWVNQA